MKAEAYAKVNLALHVSSAREGLHPIRGIFQSVEWADRLTLDFELEDAITSPGGATVIDDKANLAWRAAVAVRDVVGSRRSMRLVLDKRIPIAAGLGGGSADAAAALVLASRLLGAGEDVAPDLAPGLGSDVPFCLSGGKAIVGGVGDEIDPLAPGDRYGIALVVPPIEVSTAAVYQAWDRLEDARGFEVSGRDLPPPLRDLAPLRNDLYPAAALLEPSVDEWRAELATRWGRPVLMTGSGPSLFSFFLDVDEARGAVNDIPPGSRAAEAVAPVDRGWRMLPE